MTKTVQAIYENGIIRPLEPLASREHALLTVTLASIPPQVPEELMDNDFLHDCEGLADDRVTLEEVRTALSSIPGSMAKEILNERDDRV